MSVAKVCLRMAESFTYTQRFGDGSHCGAIAGHAGALHQRRYAVKTLLRIRRRGRWPRRSVRQ
ncbi:hypothetical protein [Lysobacter gummosus]|uniref:hypothetical protein n=1 Tax=Lysobacter gummosus TaxID=262324 RepID=UPI00362A8407